MLIVRFLGGLGNQLFQYAFMEYLKLNNSEVYADISDFQYHKHHYGYELEKIFGCDVAKADKKQIASLSINHNKLAIKIPEKLLGIRICKKSEFYESLVPLNIIASSITSDIWFSGWWQNTYYIEKVQDILRQKLVFHVPLQGKNLECYKQMQNTETVSVHIRRQDYLKDTNFAGICGIDYYHRAVEYMKEKLEKPVFLFFSDDIEWCKGNFGNREENCYIDWNSGSDSFKDMQLMSLCKNNIIANSTFSWWGAWLNSYDRKIVIMPRQWTRLSGSGTLAWKGWLRM